MADLEDKGHPQKIQKTDSAVGQVEAANADELMDVTELTRPDAHVAQLRARKARSGQGTHEYGLVDASRPQMRSADAMAAQQQQRGCRWLGFRV